MQNNFSEVFGSKRLWTFVIGAVVMLIVNLAPALADKADQLNDILLIIVASLIGGFTITDSVEATSTAKIEAAKASASSAAK